jgi:glycosyl transferase family 25
MILDRFNRIRIVNLTHRRDRRIQMEGELRRLSLIGDPRVTFFPAARPANAGDFTSIGAHGCYASHKAILDDAAAAGESVLILEDDCDFAPEAAGYDTAEPWDIFYGGYMPANWCDLAASDIMGSHMMGFSATGARLVSEYLGKLSYTGIHPPIDAAYVWFRRAHPEVATHFARPPLGHQRPSRTDIADLAFFDRWPGFREVAGAARRVKRSLQRRRSRRLR